MRRAFRFRSRKHYGSTTTRKHDVKRVAWLQRRFHTACYIQDPIGSAFATNCVILQHCELPSSHVHGLKQRADCGSSPRVQSS